MPQGMAGHQQYLELKAQHLDAVAIVECHLSGRDALKCRAPNLRVSVGVKLCNPALASGEPFACQPQISLSKCPKA